MVKMAVELLIGRIFLEVCVITPSPSEDPSRVPLVGGPARRPGD